MPTSSKIQLVVDDFGGDASAVTKLIGLEPTALGLPDGSIVDNSTSAASWMFDISMPETESVEGQALALLRFLESHAGQIQQASARYPASVAIAITRPAQRELEELSLVPLIVSEISKLGLGIRIYFPYENQNPDR